MQRLRRSSMKNSFSSSNNEPRKTFKSYVNHFREEEDESETNLEDPTTKVKPQSQSVSQQKHQPSSTETPSSFTSYFNEKALSSPYDERDKLEGGHGGSSGSGGSSKSFIASSAATLSRLALSPSTKSSSFTLPSDDDGIDLNSLGGPSRRQSFNCWTDFRDNESIITKPIDSVKRYNLHIKRSKGTIGQLFLSNRRLKFIDYHHEIQLDLERRKSLNESSYESACSHLTVPPSLLVNPVSPANNSTSGSYGTFNANVTSSITATSTISGHLNGGSSSSGSSKNKSLSSLRLPPFDIHPVSEENREIHEQDIDLMNIYQVRIESEGQDTHLTVFCNDFRSIEFEMKTNDLVKALVDKLEQLISILRASTVLPTSPYNTRSLPESALLWTLLANQYSYQYPQDWNKLEGYWLAVNDSLRIAHCNENHNMCPSLPVSFISLSQYLSDLTLLYSISPHLNGNRVPVITYCHQSSVKSSRQNLLLRCSSFKMDVTNVLHNAIRPLNVVEVNNLLPPLSKLESAYYNLRKSCCFYAEKFPHFLSQTGKWVKIVSRILSVVKEMSTILSEESSLLIIEENDDHYNPILSSLVQIVLDEKRRTISGFESLISKEFLYLNGMVHNSVVRSPDIVLFTLFLDAVWQLICQNPYQFEFTSLYLIRLYDLQTIPWRKDEPSSINQETDEFQQNSGNTFSPATATTGLTSPSSITSNPNQQITSTSSSSATITTTVATTNIISTNNPTNTVVGRIKSATHSRNPSNVSIGSVNGSNIPGNIFILNLDQLMFIYNPLYRSPSLVTQKSSDDSGSILPLRINVDLFLMKLWRPLYLRWLPLENHRQYYNYFSISEFVYFDFLLNKLDYKLVSKVNSSEEEMIESYL